MAPASFLLRSGCHTYGSEQLYSYVYVPTLRTTTPRSQRRHSMRTKQGTSEGATRRMGRQATGGPWRGCRSHPGQSLICVFDLNVRRLVHAQQMSAGHVDCRGKLVGLRAPGSLSCRSRLAESCHRSHAPEAKHPRCYSGCRRWSSRRRCPYDDVSRRMAAVYADGLRTCILMWAGSGNLCGVKSARQKISKTLQR